MICPHCYNKNVEFVEVKKHEWNKDERKVDTIRYGIAVECLDCGLRGPGAFEEDDGNNEVDAIELWDSLAQVDEYTRKLLKDDFHQASLDPRMVDWVLSALLKSKEVEWDGYPKSKEK